MYVFKQKQGKIFKNTGISKDIFIIFWGGGADIVFNPLRAADFSAHPSRATEEFSQNN